MNIALGSTSLYKKEILQKALKGKLAYWDIESVEARSGVSDQPLSIEETITGATNRAKTALNQQPNAGLAVGMEGGLELIGGIYNLVCAVAFWDGERLIIGQSGHLPLPRAVSDKIKQGGKLGQLIRQYQKTAPPEEGERLKQLISRELSFTSAINDALPKLDVGKVNSLVAWASPQLQPGIIAPKLLKLAAIISGFYVLTAPVIIVYGQAWGRPEVFAKLSVLIPASLGLILLSILSILSIPLTKSKSDLRRSLTLIAIATTLLLAVNIPLVVTVIDAVVTDVGSIGLIAMAWTPIIYIVGLVVFGLLGLALRQAGIYSIVSMATITYLLIGTMGIVQSYWILAHASGVSIFIIPTLLLGLPWSIGLWHLADELDATINPRGVKVSAFYKVDKV